MAGPRWLITIGCLLLACGPFLTDGSLSPHPAYGLLTVALGLAGIGIGVTVVPITSSVLSAVPAGRSDMAAPAANTSREIGAVTGVAILGALVTAQLRASLAAQMNNLGIPAQFQAVVNALETPDPQEHLRLRRLREDRPGGHQCCLQRLLRRPARRVVPVRRARARRRAARLRHFAFTPSRPRDFDLRAGESPQAMGSPQVPADRSGHDSSLASRRRWLAR